VLWWRLGPDTFEANLLLGRHRSGESGNDCEEPFEADWMHATRSSILFMPAECAVGDVVRSCCKGGVARTRDRMIWAGAFTMDVAGHQLSLTEVAIS
jgi:hypothetical protein